MTTEEQIQVKEAWSRLRNLSNTGISTLAPGYDQKTAQMVKETIRPLLETAYAAGENDSKEFVNADAEAREQFRDLSVTQILEALGLGIEV